MAISSVVPPPPEVGSNGSNNDPHDNEDQNATTTTATETSSLLLNASGVDIAAWTISALESLTVSGTPLAIPLDEKENKKASVSIHDPRAHYGYGAVTPPPRPSSRRDSMKRREALLRGNEGSRQRRRWENGKSPILPPLFSP